MLPVHVYIRTWTANAYNLKYFVGVVIIVITYGLTVYCYSIVQSAEAVCFLLESTAHA